MTSAGPHVGFGILVPDDDPDQLTGLVRMIVLNTVLLADAVDAREHTHIQYETAVLDRATAWTALAGLIPQGAHEPVPTIEDDLFAATNHKTSLIAQLTPTQATQVTTSTAEMLAVASGLVPPRVLDRAATWLTGGAHYQLAQRAKPPRRRCGRIASPPARQRPKPRTCNCEKRRGGTC